MSTNQYVLEATDDNFQSTVMQSQKLALVDFWAEWCGPCKQLGPVIDQIAEEFKNEILVYKMNVDHYANTPAKLQIRGIPTIIFIQNQKIVERLVGNQPKELILDRITALLKAS